MFSRVLTTDPLKSAARVQRMHRLGEARLRGFHELA